MERDKIMPMTMYGSFVTGWIRRSEKPMDTALVFSPAFTREMVGAIVNHEAHVWGNSHEGFEYREGPDPDWSSEMTPA